jgi:hypothetical protein
VTLAFQGDRGIYGRCGENQGDRWIFASPSDRSKSLGSTEGHLVTNTEESGLGIGCEPDGDDATLASKFQGD